MDHYILTYRGQSGSPVLIKFNNSYYVIGIHFGGNLKYMVNNFMIFNEEILCHWHSFRGQFKIYGQ